MSLSARRAWIEIASNREKRKYPEVALRKESVDRNYIIKVTVCRPAAVALRKESVDRNVSWKLLVMHIPGRSPQGERG